MTIFQQKLQSVQIFILFTTWANGASWQWAGGRGGGLGGEWTDRQLITGPTYGRFDGHTGEKVIFKWFGSVGGNQQHQASTSTARCQLAGGFRPSMLGGASSSASTRRTEVVMDGVEVFPRGQLWQECCMMEQEYLKNYCCSLYDNHIISQRWNSKKRRRLKAQCWDTVSTYVVSARSSNATMAVHQFILPVNKIRKRKKIYVWWKVTVTIQSPCAVEPTCLNLLLFTDFIGEMKKANSTTSCNYNCMVLIFFENNYRTPKRITITTTRSRANLLM